MGFLAITHSTDLKGLGSQHGREFWGEIESKPGDEQPNKSFAFGKRVRNRPSVAQSKHIIFTKNKTSA